jgi:predicted DNA-binding protein (MmcQ/YjbR family)
VAKATLFSVSIGADPDRRNRIIGERIGTRLESSDPANNLARPEASIMKTSVLNKMREICLSLPDTKETPTWGKPHFRVRDKIFAGCGDENGKPVIGFKLEMAHAESAVRDPRFWPAPYVGHKGWVSMDASAITDWDEVRTLLMESYRLIAPKGSLAKLGPEEGSADRPPPNAKTKRAGVKSAARKTRRKRRP